MYLLVARQYSSLRPRLSWVIFKHLRLERVNIAPNIEKKSDRRLKSKVFLTLLSTEQKEMRWLFLHSKRTQVIGKFGIRR